MKSQHLFGIHDWSPAWGQMVHDAGKSAWCVTTHALSTLDRYDFRSLLSYNVTPIARLNWGYGSTGTIPTHDRYADFAETCAEFVARSPGCIRWIIGNEPNHAHERPNGLSITPEMYSDCFLRCREAIRDAAGTQQHVMPAAIAPWNISSGDWLEYFSEVMRLTGGGDGICLHTYTHGAYPGLITSEARMDPPYEDRRYEFRAYLDFLHAIPGNVPDLPVYITETDQTEAWVNQDNGWIPAAYGEIDRFNRVSPTKIHALVLYRWPNYDIWGFESKPGVHAGFRAALAQDYRIPQVVSDKSPDPIHNEDGVSQDNHKLHIPKIGEGDDDSDVLDTDSGPREWDPRLTELGVRIVPAEVEPGEEHWRVVRGQWLDEGEADRVGPDHHILVDVLDESGKRLPGMDVYVQWPGGEHMITTQPKPDQPYAADYPMSTGRNAFRVTMPVEAASDIVTGLGMGAPTPDGGFNAGIHTSTMIVFQRASVPEEDPMAEQPAPQPLEPNPARSHLLDTLVMEAFIAIESGGRAFGPDGRLLIRFEAHIYARHAGQREKTKDHFRWGTDERPWEAQMFRSGRNPQWRPIHTGDQATEWEAFEVALALDPPAARQSISMGAPQIMGFNAGRIGYDSAAQMFDSFSRSEHVQIVGLVNYILTSPGLVSAVQQRDWHQMATLYNGSGQAEHYAGLLKAKYEELRG